MSWIREWALHKLEPLFKQGELWLHRHGHWFGAIAFVLTLLFACLWFLQARHMNAVATSLLTHEREPVPQKFPSLDSLILSKSDFSNAAEPRRPSQQATRIADEIFASLISNEEKVVKKDKAAANSTESTISLHTVSSDSGDSQPTISKQYLYDDDASAALFIPAFTLLASSGRLQGLEESDIPSTLQSNPQLVKDIEASRRVAKALPKFNGVPLFEGSNEPAAQAYFITTTGVTRMWQSNASPTVTRDNFNPHRVFQDRPYFWPTLENPQKERNAYSYMSKPYFDVAGNGIVITACWAISARKLFSDAVLCLDSLRPVDLREVLKEYISADPGSFTCKNRDDGQHECDFDQLAKGEEQLKNQLEIKRAELDSKRRFDDLQGGLYVVHRERGPFDAWIHKLTFRGSGILRFLFSSDEESTVYFSVPQPRSQQDKDKRITKFDVYEVSLSRPHLWLVSYALLTFGFGIAAAVCFYVLHRSRVYAVQFMREVETIMTLSPVAFCYLDECDHITSHNQAFCDLVGYDKNELVNVTLQSLLEKGDSQTRYNIVTKFREKLLPTPPYEVRLIRKDQTTIPVVISGSPLYIQPRNRHGGRFNQRPHTFGIILKPSEARIRNYVPFEARDFEGALRVMAENQASGATV